MIKRILAAMVAFVMIFSCMPVFAHAEEAANASGTTYYVSSLNGAEGNSGTSESEPFESLLKINEITLQPGDRVLLERGSVFVNEYLHVKGSGNEEAPIIIDAYGEGELPLIQTNGYGVWHQNYGKRADNVNHQIEGDVSSCILLYDVEYIEISNIAMTNEGNFAAGEVYNTARRMDRTGVAGVAQNIGTVNHIYLRNLDIRNVQGNVYNKHMCNGGIYFVCHYAGAGEPVARYDDILIEGCRLDKVNRWGIAVGYTAYWDGIPYGLVIPEDAIIANGSTNVVIRNNYLTEVGGDGITTMYCYKPLIEYNVVDGYCRDITPSVYQYPENRGGMVAAGIWPWMCKTALFQYNECYSSTYNQDGQAWDADWGDNAIYQYNYSCNNAGGTIMFCGAYAANTVFRYNISQDDLSGVLNITGSPNGEVYNNVFFMKEGVYVNRLNMSGGRNNVVSNNIFYYNSETPASEALSNWNDIGAVWTSNIYYNFSKIPADAYAITADPLFVDPGKGPTGAQESGLFHDLSAFEGYKLQPESPAINAGTPIENNGGKDFFGNELDLIPDIGAYEAGTFVSDATKAVTVDVELGETVTITDLVNSYEGITPVVENSKIASVAIDSTITTIRTAGDAVTSLTDGKYILVNNRANKTLTNADAAQEAEAGAMNGLSLNGTKANIADNAIWTITASGTGYTVQDLNGKYLTIRSNDADVVDGESIVNVAYNGTWTLSQNGAYLNDAANKAVCASGWQDPAAATDAGSLWTIYPFTEETIGSTELTFTGLFPGSTGITIGDTLYIVRVAGVVEAVELTVGETATFEDRTGNYTDADTSALDETVATVELKGLLMDVYALGSKVTTLEDGAKYILVNTRANKPVTNAVNGTGLLFTGTKEAAANAAVWTITAAEGGYYVQDLDGNYMTVGSDTAAITAEPHALALNFTGSTWTISEDGSYLNQHGGATSTKAAGWKNAAAATDAGSQWEFYAVTASQAENGTTITFTGVGEGNTYILIGGIVYDVTVTNKTVHEHSFGEWTITTEPTCTKAGEETRSCSCGETETREVAALGHTAGEAVKENEKPATCTEDGSYDSVVYCSACGAEISRETITVAASCASSVYTDVPVGDWYHEAVDYVTAEGIMNGMTGNTFEPGTNTNRAMMAVLLYRLAGSPSVEGQTEPFTDVEAGQWFYEAVVWAYNEGIVNGMSATTFAPGMSINRAQMVTMMYRYAGSPDVDASVLEGYTDADTLGFSADAFAWAIANGVVTGLTDTTLAPTATANRAQIATILYRYLSK